MIQRIQSVWLLVAAAATGLSLYLPLYKGLLPEGVEKELLAGSYFLLMIVGVLLTLGALMAIFFFKNRKTQKQIIILSILIEMVFTGLIFMEASNFATTYEFKSQSYLLAAVLPVIAIVFLLMAYSAIKKDEKLIKSADRLR